MGKIKTGILTGIYNTNKLMPKIYITWAMMKQRCFNQNHIAFKRYGGRGITVCDRWLKFENFYKDLNNNMIEHISKFGKKQTTLDRIDNNKGYSPDNCRWVTRSENSSNTSLNKILEYNGIKRNYSQWRRLNGNKFASRLNRGITDKEKLFANRIITKFGVSNDVKMTRNIILTNFKNTDMLKKRHKNIFLCRFGINDGKIKTLQETANIFNVSRERVRQICAKSIQILANYR